MNTKRSSRRPKLLLVLLTAQLLGCASGSPKLPPQPVPPPRIDPLPTQARQPQRPPICTPTCSDGLTRLYEQLLDSLTTPPLPAPPASASTTR